MKTLVTGGAGFIGSHLVGGLLAQGHEVRVVDNFSTGQESNLEEFKNDPHLSVHRADISNDENLARFFSEVDWVFHLAGLADIVPSVENPVKYHQANVDGTIHVLQAARSGHVKRLIYAASSTCYGIPDLFPTPESAAIRTLYPYAFTKYVGEQYVMHWAKLYKLPCISLRLFNVYGPRSRTSGTYGAVFGVFLAQKLAGKPFTVVGSGEQTRDFTYVTDVVSAFIAAANSEIAGEVFNVGSGGTYSINELVVLLGGETLHLPKRPGEPDCTFADIRKIRSCLRWEPRIGFKKGVGLMLQHIDQWKNAPVWDKQSIACATKEWFTYLGKAFDDDAK